MIAVTGATGKLGSIVIERMLKRIPAAKIVVAVRNPEKAKEYAAKGISVRRADYSQPETLQPAFADVNKLLLISSSEIGKRYAQHKAVIDAAKAAGVKLIAYTSVLHADSSLLGLAEEHRQTEDAIRQAGIPFVLLRNSWYTENYTGAIPQALQRGALIGCAGSGRISSASRVDYADAAIVVLTSNEDQSGRIYELAGDLSYTLAELASEVTRQSGKEVKYEDMPLQVFKNILLKTGLPEPIAELLADSDAAAAKNALFDDTRELSKLIGRPTTTMSSSVAATLQG
jgi:NAD(P)H dehydrogenase (quinone)